MVEQEELIKVVNEVDTFLIDQIVENNLSPLAIASIVMARLIVLNQNVNSDSEFYKLIRSVADRKHLEPERILQ